MYNLRQFLYLDDNKVALQKVANWQISALRIILITILSICVATLVHGACFIYESYSPQNIFLAFGLAIVMVTLLSLSRKLYIFSAHTLLVSIIFVAAALHFFVPTLQVAQVSPIITYATPVIALLLIGRNTAIFYVTLNLVAFFILFLELKPSSSSAQNALLINANYYIHSLVFFFFNICIPLAVWRTSLAANRLQLQFKTHTHLLEKQKNLYRKFFQNSYSAIVLVNDQQQIVEANQKAKQLLNLYHYPLPCPIRHVLHCALDKEGKLFKVNSAIVQIDSQDHHEKSLAAWYLSDASEQFYLQQQFNALGAQHHQTKYFNTHVNLPNKTWLSEQLDTAIQSGNPFLLVIADHQDLQLLEHGIDAEHRKHFYKHINLLIEHHNHASSAVSYLGSGRLGFIASHSEPLLDAAKHWQQAFDFWIRLGELHYHAKYAISIAAYPSHGYSAEQLIKNAIQACELRQPNSLCTVFDYSLKKQRLARNETALLLEKALENKEIEIYLQGKHLACGRIIGFEALARWHSHILGFVPAGEFIPIAEEFGLIELLTKNMIEQLCQVLAAYPQLPVPIAINISARDLEQANFVEQLKTLLKTHKIAPNVIELELTEYSIANDREHTLVQLRALHQYGIKLSIDDFGTGYSNISRLLEYPISRLKFDRSLLDRVEQDRNQRALLSGMVKICAKIGIAALAEGVETKAQRDALSELGMQEFQGYLYSKPKPIEDVLTTYQNDINLYTHA